MDLAGWVRNELRARNIKQKALSDFMEWPSGDASRKLNGTRPISLEDFVKILSFLGYDLETFLNATPPVSSDADAISRLADNLDEEQRLALLVYLRMLSKKGT